jgi:hypothetical protein
MRTVLVVSVLAVGLVSGCTSVIDKQSDVLRGMATDVVGRFQSDLSSGQFTASGQGLNPGYVVEAGVIYRATVRLDGLAGQFGMGVSGPLGERELSPTALRILESDRLDAEYKLQLLRELLAGSLSPAEPVSPGEPVE